MVNNIKQWSKISLLREFRNPLMWLFILALSVVLVVPTYAIFPSHILQVRKYTTFFDLPVIEEQICHPSPFDTLKEERGCM